MISNLSYFNPNSKIAKKHPSLDILTIIIMETPSDMSLLRKSTALKLFEIPSLIHKSENQSSSSLYNDENKAKFFKEKLGWNSIGNLDLLKDCFNLHYYFSNQAISKFALTKNNQILLALSNYCYIYAYLLAEGKVVGILKGKNIISDFILIENSSEVLYYTATNINLWNYENDVIRKIVDENLNQISTVSVSFDNRYLAAGYIEGSIYIIDNENYQLKITLSYHKSKINALTFSEDNKTLISADGWVNESPESKIGVWDIQKEALLIVLVGHPFPVYTLKIDKRNKYFLSVSHDKTIRLWNLEQALLRQDSSERLINQKYKTFEYRSYALEKFSSIKSKYQLKKFYSVDQICYSEELQMYGKDILSQFKDIFEVSRLVFPSEWFFTKHSMIEVFYESTCIMVFNLKTKSVEIYDIPNFHMQRVIDLSGIGCLKKVFFISNENIAVMDNYIFVHLINLTSQEEKNYYLIGSYFSLYNFRIAKKRYIISLFSDIYARTHTISVFDLYTSKFLGHYLGDSDLISDTEISKNGIFLLLKTQSNVVKIINLETRTLLGKLNTDDNVIKKFGFTSDSNYIATYQEIPQFIKKHIGNDDENKEAFLAAGYAEKGIIFSFYEVENWEQFLIRKVINKNSKIEVVKFRNQVYFSRPSTKSKLCNLCNTDERMFSVKNGKTWTCCKNKKYGVFAQNQLYSVFRLIESEICSLSDS